MLMGESDNCKFASKMTNEPTPSSIQGAWKSESGENIQFFKNDGTGYIQSGESATINFTYSYNAPKLAMTILPEKTDKYNYTVLSYNPKEFSIVNMLIFVDERTEEAEIYSRYALK